MEDESRDMEDGNVQMSVLFNQVQTFLRTLKGYTEECVAAKSASQKTVEETKKLLASVLAAKENIESTNKKTLNEIKELHADIVAVQEKQSVDLGTIRNEMKRMEAISKIAVEANSVNVNIRRTMERVENKESFICTFVDIVKQSERMCRTLYTRTVYASTICREVAASALATLEGAMRLLQLVEVNFRKAADTGEDATDGISEGASAMDSKSATTISDLLLKTRYLKADVQNMDQAAELMDKVRLLDTSMWIATGEMEGNCMECEDLG